MTQLQLDQFKAYRQTIIFDIIKRCQSGYGCQYIIKAINSPVKFNQYSFHVHEGQAQEEIKNLIDEAKDIITKTIIDKLNESNNNRNNGQPIG